jgi:sugar (pentulose or hexulose) kinase
MDGLGMPSGALVYSPLGDNQAGVAGVLDVDDALAVVNVGTSSQLSVLRGEFAFDSRFETRPFPRGRFLQTFAALCGGWSYAYLARFFAQLIEQITGRPIELGEVYAGMDRIAQGGAASGLRVDTRFAGDRVGGAGRTGSICGITTGNLTPQNLVRAFVEGIADELAEAAIAIDLREVEGLALVGNAVRRNPALRDAIQASFGLPCCLGDVPEEAAYGAARAVIDFNVEARQRA